MLRSVLSYCIIALSVMLISGISYGWVSEDIGTTDVGSTEQVGSSFTLTAGGADIWGNTDGFRMVYEEVSGDFEISAQLVSLENTNSWAKAGVMARGSNAPDSWFAWSFVTVGNGTSFQWRTTDGDRCWPDGGGIAGVAPYYVKLVREGNDFFGYRSEDGVAWEENNTSGQPNTVTIEDISDPILVGLAHTSHSAGNIGTSEFTHVITPTAVNPKGKVAVTWAGIKESH
ncbi:MAG: hypothetical protein H8D67_05405 [Deltaproteobacteria bacterium]|nr:hypothetical protein [Deltaproteobacteria bacterium]